MRSIEERPTSRFFFFQTQSLPVCARAKGGHAYVQHTGWGRVFSTQASEELQGSPGGIGLPCCPRKRSSSEEPSDQAKATQLERQGGDPSRLSLPSVTWRSVPILGEAPRLYGQRSPPGSLASLARKMKGADAKGKIHTPSGGSREGQFPSRIPRCCYDSRGESARCPFPVQTRQSGRVSCQAPAPSWTLPPAPRCPGMACGSMDSRAWAPLTRSPGHPGAAECGRALPGGRTRKVNAESGLRTCQGVGRPSVGGCGCLRRLGPWVTGACGESRHPGPRDLGRGVPALATWPCSGTAWQVLGGVPFSFPAPTAGTSVPPGRW